MQRVVGSECKGMFTRNEQNPVLQRYSSQTKLFSQRIRISNTEIERIKIQRALIRKRGNKEEKEQKKRHQHIKTLNKPLHCV
jgi:hypothetical protein